MPAMQSVVGAASSHASSLRTTRATAALPLTSTSASRARHVRHVLASSQLLPSTSGRSFAGASTSGPSSSSARGSVQCQGLFGLGLPELAVIAGVAVLVFGPSKLPEVGKSLGKTLKSFQTAAKEFETELKSASADDPVPPPPAATPQDQEERVKRTD